jgi:CheY-like chemotaxis protein
VGFDARARLQRSDEALPVRRDGDTAKRFPSCNGLLRVLVADDNPNAADCLSRLVKTWVHDVRVAYDGAAALEMTSAYQPNVLLLDMAMPKMDGCQVAQELRGQARFKHTLLIAVTGYADEAHRRLWEEPFDHYLIKPIDPLTLKQLLLREQDRLAGPPEVPLASPRKYCLLVVDDEECMRGVLNLAMRQQGFEVRLAANGREAIDLYRQDGRGIDVVLLDVRMPGLDGPQTLAALQALNPQIRCCFMSGDLGSYTESTLTALGAAALLLKPFRLAEVAQVLSELVSSADHAPRTFRGEGGTDEWKRNHDDRSAIRQVP